ncbi:hypothetical protein D3C80_1604160 [compost metagenome]
MSTYERSRRGQPRVAFVPRTGVGPEKVRHCAEKACQAAFPIRDARIEQVGKRLQQPLVQRRRSTPGLCRQLKALRL